MNSVLVILTTISILLVCVVEANKINYENINIYESNIMSYDYEDYGCFNEPHEPESINIESDQSLTVY